MRPLPALIPALLLLAAACSSGSPAAGPTPAPTVTPTSGPTASPTDAATDLGPAEFDPARAFEHVQALETIGPRPAGSQSERDAAEYLRGELASYGYAAELQPFSFDVFADAGSSLTVLSADLAPLAVYPFEPNLDAAAEGELVDAGIGEPDDFPANTSGRIALIERGVLFFGDKVASAEAAGATGAIIYNNAPGLYSAPLPETPGIPVVSLSQEDGRELLALMGTETVRVRMEVRTQTGLKESQNVVATPPDGECLVVAGGHYDSVATGPGANDNASGTATAVEMARVLAADGSVDEGVCFVLFGAEEVGLIGSARYVASLSEDERAAMKAMLNFDMVGTGSHWYFIGHPSVVDASVTEAGSRDLDFITNTTDVDGGSDHASFLNADIPAIFFHSFTNTVADDPHYHTSEDKAEYVRPTRMAQIAEVGLAVIDDVLGPR